MTSISNTSSPLAVTGRHTHSHALQSLRIKHPHIKQVMDELDSLIYTDSQDCILMVCGPTGVGKSALAHQIVKAEIERSAAEMQVDAGIIPAAYVEARASGERDFSWRLFYQSVLEQLDPDLELPKYHFGIDSRTGRLVRSSSPKDGSLAGLRTTVERSLRNRRCRFLVIDEAAHMIHQTRRHLESPRVLRRLFSLRGLSHEEVKQVLA